MWAIAHDSRIASPFDLLGHGRQWGRIGRRDRYAYEQLAEGLMVKIVERYLAEFRPLLRERPECHTALMRILRCRQRSERT